MKRRLRLFNVSCFTHHPESWVIGGGGGEGVLNQHAEGSKPDPT